MKKARFLILTAVLFCFQSASYAQNYDNNKSSDIHEVNAEASDQLRPGMKLMKVGGINMLVPEGTKFYKQGAQVKMEQAGEYSARRFKEMDERLSKTDERIMKVEMANEDAARISREIDERLKKTEVASEDVARRFKEIDESFSKFSKIDERIMKVEMANEDAARISREIDERLKNTEVASADAARISHKMSARITKMEKKDSGMSKKIQELITHIDKK
ncbi:MAG: hypothetical protein KKE81_02465 [Candidatus Omnitrophica bacterium]|nr:hypothetical protein [Candidatus Omnitrophota bacterium]MBU1808903.1 hypothetical protein [Candidatus Omnitrophota bacterium]